MGVISEIQGIKSETFILGLLDLLFLLSPGTIIIFLYYPELFQSLDWVKLVLLSSSITLPFTFINTLLAILVGESKNNDDLFIFFSLGIIITGIITYISIACLYLFGKPLKSILIFGAILQILVSIWILYNKKPKQSVTN